MASRRRKKHNGKATTKGPRSRRGRQPEPAKDPQGGLLFRTISNPKKRAFLAAFAHRGQVVKAATMAGIHWQSHYNWLEQDDEYAKAFEKAKQVVADRIEDAFFHRAVNGTDAPVIYEGEITDTYKKYDTTAGIVLLKALRPDKYRENVNLSGHVGLPVEDFYNRIAEHHRQREEEKS